MASIFAILQNLATLTVLLIAFPINSIIVISCLLGGFFRRQKRTIAENPKTVMLTGGKMTKALQLARSFHAAGHRVI
ncbi:MAG: ATP-grasp enzyme, partial [Coleofasciculaceae cyanobacterium]